MKRINRTNPRSSTCDQSADRKWACPLLNEMQSGKLLAISFISLLLVSCTEDKPINLICDVTTVTRVPADKTEGESTLFTREISRKQETIGVSFTERAVYYPLVTCDDSNSLCETTISKLGVQWEYTQGKTDDGAPLAEKRISGNINRRTGNIRVELTGKFTSSELAVIRVSTGQCKPESEVETKF